MRSGYKITWSGEALHNLSQIIAYLEANWTEKEIRKFAQKLEKSLHLISIFPEIYPSTSKRKRVRKCVLTKQTSLYYKVIRKEIFVVTVFDNRQDPNKLKV